MVSLHYYLFNLIIPGYALHRIKSTYALAGWFGWLAFCALLIWHRSIFSIQGFVVVCVITFCVVGLCHCMVVRRAANFSVSRYSKASLGHFLIAIAFYGLLASNAKEWFGFEFYYVPTESMSPSILSHDVLLSDVSDKTTSAVRQYDVIVFNDPLNPDRQLVKRVAGVSNSGLYVLGDNTGKSHDSRHFGEINPEDVTAVARWVVGRWESRQFKLGIHAIAAPHWVK